MKITSIILLVCIQAQATGHAQSVSLNYKNAKPETVLQDIADQIQFNLVYSKDFVKNAKPVTIQANNIPYSAAIDACMEGQLFTYKIVDKSIVLSLKRHQPSIDLTSEGEEIKGRVIDETGKPIAGATIRSKRGNKSTMSNDNGEFTLTDIDNRTVLTITCIGYAASEMSVNNENLNSNIITIVLKVKNTDLEEVTVQSASTGYYDIPKDRATGSFDVIGNKLLNRRVSTNIIDRIDGVASGVLFNRNNIRGNVPTISIRGRSTIFANAEPLVILDNFPYTGGLQNINPNDIETITVLKDAAAASIWGAYSGNGVIVLTSKKGKLNSAPKISVNTNITFGEKPDLYYRKQLQSTDFIEIENLLFDKGFYDVYLQYVPYAPQSPVIEILDKQKKGLIDHPTASNLLNQLRNTDIRDAYTEYFLKTSLNQQYSISVSGGGDNSQYYVSGGYDHNKGSYINNTLKRVTFTAQNTTYFFKKNLELNARITAINSKTSQPESIYTPKYPYEQPADSYGNPLPVVKDYRLGFLDTAARDYLLDWKYYPLTERNPNLHTNWLDYKIDAGISYRISNGLKASFLYQYGKGIQSSETQHSQSSYANRHYYNLYTYKDPSSGMVTHSVPRGSIVINNDNNYSNHFVRLGLSYEKSINEKHFVSAIAGYEQRKVDQFSKQNGLYGYDPSTATNTPVDYNQFLRQYFGGSGKINNYTRQYGSADRSRSYYANASYSYDEIYVLSLSARKDESNIFGVKSNQRAVPLWSTGISYQLSKETFYTFAIVPYLKVRATYGHNGNVDKTTYANTTILVDEYNSFGNIAARIVNPPNPSLRWEKIKTTNLALDFAFKKNRITGTFEWYSKKGIDLIGFSDIAPQLGVIHYKGNNASTKTTGVDITLHSLNIDKKLKWKTTVLISFAKEIVTKNNAKQQSNEAYVNSNPNNPLEGKPYGALFAFKWAGLDTSGNPQGIWEGKPSTQYQNILYSQNTAELVYIGSGLPTRFGSLRNTFTYAGFEVSANITYKGGYFMRNPAVRYAEIFNNSYIGIDQISNRWKTKGDELRTHIPSLIYPADPNRDRFYALSELHVEKADHIRLQDIQVSYEVPRQITKAIGISYISIYGYVNNIGILWRANNNRIDPDAGADGTPVPRTFAIGLRTNF